MVKYLTMLILSCGLCWASAQALDVSNIEHTPPQFSFGEEVVAEIPAEGFIRARVLLASQTGLVPVEMERVKERFRAALPIQDVTVLTYRIQVESEAHELYLSSRYTVPLPDTKSVQKKVEELTEQSNELEGTVHQLEANLRTLKSADPQILAHSKTADLARAVLVLNQKEQEYEKQRTLAESAWAKTEQTLDATPKGKAVQAARQAADLDNSIYFNAGVK